MCGRFIPLTLVQVLDVIRSLAHGRATGEYRAVELGPEWETVPRDAFPGQTAQLILPLDLADAESAAAPGTAADKPAAPGLALAPAELSWGFDAPFASKRGPVFNTRIETALRDADRGHGLWAGPIEQGRCLVPCRAFFEPSRDETVPSPRTGRPIKRQYEFATPDAPVTLLAGVQEGGRFSVVTTEPNGTMEPVHDRMPLVLAPHEVPLWLAPGDGYRALQDRSGTPLWLAPEDARWPKKKPAAPEDDQLSLF